MIWRCISIAAKDQLAVNEGIRAKEVRVIGDDGSQLGIMSCADAMRLAGERNLDLVEISPTAEPPVCKMMDYGKYRFEKQKREKEQRKNQKVVELKEIRLSLNIGEHDFDTKLSHAQKFLLEGNKVKASIRFRGREMAHASRGNGVMARFAEALAEYGSVEKEPKLEGRSMQMFITPKPASAKADKKNAEPSAEDTTDNKPEGKPEKKAEPKAETKDAKPEAEVKTQAKPEKKAEPKAEAKTQEKPEKKAETKAAKPKAEPKAEPKAAKPEADDKSSE